MPEPERPELLELLARGNVRQRPARSQHSANEWPVSTAEGQPISQRIGATDPMGGSLSYSATGLPSGVTIDPVSGLVSGTPTVPGSYSVLVKATSAQGGTSSVTLVIPSLSRDRVRWSLSGANETISPPKKTRPYTFPATRVMRGQYQTIFPSS